MDTNGKACHDCGARPGELHGPGCDVENCPYCGHQLLFGCCGRKLRQRDRMPWTGLFPGVKECREYGFFCRQVEGQGWVRCGPDDPEATEDLIRLNHEARWDPAQKRYVLRDPPAATEFAAKPTAEPAPEGGEEPPP